MKNRRAEKELLHGIDTRLCMAEYKWLAVDLKCQAAKKLYQKYMFALHCLQQLEN